MKRLALGVALLVSAPAAAQGPAESSEGRRTLAAHRLAADDRIELDGVLDEAAWQRAVPATDFIQQDPENGALATEQTEVRILFNKDSLYMGVICRDSEPDKWIGYQRRRDEFLSSDDRFMWVIDTYNNQQSSYFFEMNPSGLMADAVRSSTFNNRQWDGIWNAKVVKSEIGWTLEIEIPFRTLSFDPQAAAWGINFQRTVRRKNEESVWTGWLRNQGLNRLSNAGLLVGLTDVEVGRGLDIKPYVLGTSESFPGRGDSSVENDANVGLDVFYSPTPQMRTNLTINTDFAQTEVDQRLTNLTRFPQFFPEKRDFFLDGSPFFDFQSTAQGGNSLMPFFTRRIGLDENGNPQKIDVGGKLAGQIGRNDIGALYVRTGVDEHTGLNGTKRTVPGEDFAVLRLKHRMFQQSYAGMIYTGRSTRGPEAVGMRHTLGADFLLATSTFRGSDQLSVGGFFVNTSRPDQAGQSRAYGVAVDYPNDPWSSSFYYREIQENYNAEVGFTPRRGFRRLVPALAYTVRPRGHRWLRSAQFGAEADVILDAGTVDNFGTLNRDLRFTALNVNTHSGDGFSVNIVPSYEMLENNFNIAPGITLPRGSDYTYTRYQFSLNTAQRRVIAFGPTLEVGGFYNGTRRRVAMNLNIRLRPGVIIYTSGEWNSVELDEGSFDTRLYRIVPELQFSPWTAWVNNIQYDTQSRLLGWQSRFRWILRPGNDIYLVYTHNWIDDPLQSRLYTLDRRAATKFLYTKRF